MVDKGFLFEKKKKTALLQFPHLVSTFPANLQVHRFTHSVHRTKARVTKNIIIIARQKYARTCSEMIFITRTYTAICPDVRRVVRFARGVLLLLLLLQPVHIYCICSGQYAVTVVHAVPGAPVKATGRLKSPLETDRCAYTSTHTQV